MYPSARARVDPRPHGARAGEEHSAVPLPCPEGGQ
jgi:hypothetical protein